MIELDIRGTRQGLDVDLLPWADPYIMQLFLEAEMLEDGDEPGAASAPAAGFGAHSPQAVAAALRGDSWGINSNRRPPLPRRRRTESERLLVRC
jgi:hypothetical protein